MSKKSIENMKALFFLLMLPIGANAQVKQIPTPETGIVGHVKIMGDLIAKIEWVHNGTDSTYSLVFKDLNYRYLNEYKRVDFKNKNGALDSLYSILLRAFDLPKLSTSRFELGNETFELVRRKHMGFNGINIILLRNNANFGITKKDLDLLFGKSKDE
jgi:hypothetical protein